MPSNQNLPILTINNNTYVINPSRSFSRLWQITSISDEYIISDSTDSTFIHIIERNLVTSVDIVIVVNDLHNDLVILRQTIFTEEDEEYDIIYEAINAMLSPYVY